MSAHADLPVMDDQERDVEAQRADQDARRAKRLEILWWIITPMFIIGVQVIPEKIFLSLTAAMSAMALAITYGAKKEAALSKKAGYENP